MKKRIGQKALALLIVLTIVVGMLPAAMASEGINLVQNPGFDDASSWTWSSSGSGVASGHFWLTANGYVTQSIEIPSNGTYKLSGKMATYDGNDSATYTFGIRYQSGSVIKEKRLAIGLSAYTLIELDTFELYGGDVVEIYSACGNDGTCWINGDDIVLCKVDSDTPEIPEADYSGNLLQNADFEVGNVSGWTTAGSAGVQTNNPHAGRYGFYLNGGTANTISQTVTVPYSGFYKNSAYISTGGAGCVYGNKAANGSILVSAELPSGSTYGSAQNLPPVELKQGDQVTVYVTGGTTSVAWANGDDISLSYDFSNVTYNLLSNLSLSGNLAIRLPWAGDYIFTANVAGDGVIVGETPVGSGAVTQKLTGLSLNALLEITIPEGCTVTNGSLTFDVSTLPNNAPSASDVNFSGVLHSGQTLVGTYDFNDSDEGQAGNEGSSTFRWLSAASIDGLYAPIEGATEKSLLLTDELDQKYIRFEVSPVDGYGKSGEAVTSDPQGPVAINYVRNSSLDIESTNGPEGWTVKNGGATPNEAASARTGFRLARIPANDEDAEVFYSMTLPMTANYTAGAYVKTSAAGGILGVRTSTGDVLAYVELPNTNGSYQFIEVPSFATESEMTVEIFLKGTSGCSRIDADDFQLLYKNQEDLPAFISLYEFAVEGANSCVRDSANRTITVTVPYGTDISSLEVTATVSKGAEISPASGSKVDFSNPVTFTISNGTSTATWTVSVVVAEKRLTLSSDNKTLEEGFNWAVDKTQQFVMTGTQNGKINFGDGGKYYGPGGIVVAAPGDYEWAQPNDYIPSYWAGYYDRTAFYSRDFVHQATGAQIVGLADENYSMFYTFAANVSEDRAWYTPWAFNFDGSIYYMDYPSDTRFVREVTAQFELVEKAYKAYLWSGDRRYIEDSVMWNFYTKVMTDFVELHDGLEINGGDARKNGVAEGVGDIWEGTSSYNERGTPKAETGDSFSAQYQATLAYAAMLKERGEIEESVKWYQKAEDLRDYYNNDWSVVEGSDLYAYAVDRNGNKSTDWTKSGHAIDGGEPCFFMPMKQIIEPGEKLNSYLAYIDEKASDPATRMDNIEAYTYLPDTFFPYNLNDTAWKYMEYILSVKDNPHERPSQGTNGDYPEISYTFISQTIEGMMGMEADAANHKVVTAPRLPSAVHYVEVKYIQMGNHELSLTHDGLAKSVLYNDAEDALEWEARFYGEYKGVYVNGSYLAAQQKEVNGVTVSYVTITVPAYGIITAEATNESEPEQITYTVTFSSNGGSRIDSQTVEAGGYATDPGAPIRVGYVFEGWYCDVACTQLYNFMTPVNSDLMLYAGWSEKYIPSFTPSKPTDSTEPTEPERVEILFRDVDKGDWYYEAVEYVYINGLMNGVGDNKFAPDDSVSRAMVWTVLARMEDVNTNGGDTWYAKAQAWAMREGVSDGTNPMANVTREQLAVMLYRYVGSPAVSGNLSAYPDGSKVSDWAEDAMIWATSVGLINGMNGKLNPKGSASRAQLATMLMRFEKIVKA